MSLLTTTHHFQAGKLIVTEPLCRPFIIAHLVYVIINTIVRFLIPTPFPNLPQPSTGLLCLPSPLPFHHSRNMLHHLLSSFSLLLLNTLTLSHTTPFLFTDPTLSTPRRLRYPSELRSSAQRPARIVPVWLRGAGGIGGVESRDGLVMWDWSVCVVLMYGVALVLSILHQRFFSPFTFPPSTASASSSSFASLSAVDRRRQLQLSYLFSVLLLLALCALLFCAYQLHLDAFVYLVPWSLIEAVRVADNWLVMARGGKVRGEVEKRAKEEAEEKQTAKQTAESDRRELDQLASYAVRSGLHQRHAASANR